MQPFQRGADEGVAPPERRGDILCRHAGRERGIPGGYAAALQVEDLGLQQRTRLGVGGGRWRRAMRLRCTEKSLYSSTHPPTPNDAARTRISRQSSFWKYRMRELLWWGRGVGCPGTGCDGRLRGVEDAAPYGGGWL